MGSPEGTRRATGASVNFTEINVVQGTPEWLAARIGRVTGSKANCVTMKGRSKNEPSVTKRDYCLRLACERLTGRSLDEDYKNDHMIRGSELEPEAFGAYEALTGNVVHRSGFLAHTELLIGCSLDGHLGDFDGLLEIKAPKSSTHLRYVREGRLPPEYVNQVTHCLFVTGAAFCDFFSYDPRFPVELQAFCLRVERRDVDLVGYEMALLAFLTDIDAEVKAVEALRAARMVAA